MRSEGGQGNGGESNFPVVSSDGRFVAFTSGKTNLIGNDSKFEDDIFRRGPLR